MKKPTNVVPALDVVEDCVSESFTRVGQERVSTSSRLIVAKKLSATYISTLSYGNPKTQRLRVRDTGF